MDKGLHVCFEQGMKSPTHPASSSDQQGRETALLPAFHLAHLGRRSVLLTLHQSSLVPGGVITDTITFISITANKRNPKLW